MYLLGYRADNGRPIALDDFSRRIHAALVGATGTGKSTLLARLMRDDIESGRGFALIDPHGDLAAYVADCIPPDRMDDVIFFDPSDPTHAVGFNPLTSCKDDAVLTAQLVAACKHIWQDSWGPRLEYILGMAIRLLLAVPGASIIALPRLLVDEHYRSKLLQHCKDPAVRQFWQQEFAAYPEKFRLEAIAPIQNKIGQLVANPTIRAVFGQPSTIDIPAIINGRKILIANLSKRMGEEPSHLLGAFLVTAFAQAAEERATIPEENREDFTLYVDEFQNFATTTFASILSEMRKWRLNLVVANQFMGQVPDILRQSILGNVGTLAVFRIGAEDAELMAAHLGLPRPNVLTETANFTAWVVTTDDSSRTTARLIDTEPPHEWTPGSFAAVRANTRARYARKREQVERLVAPLFAEARAEKRAKRRRVKSPERRW